MALSFQSQVKFRNVPEEKLEEFRFNGGLITDKHETKLDSRQTPNLGNVIYSDTESIKTRNGYTRYNNDPIGATSDESNTGTSTGTISLDAVGDYVAQTFQVGTSANMVQADFYLAMANSGEQQLVRMELWSGNTGPDARLYSSQILLVSGTAETEYSFRVRVPQSLTLNTEYAVVLRPFVRGTTQTIREVLVHHTGNDYASGAAYTSTDNGSTWSAVANTDLKFNIYTGGDTGGTGLLRYYNDTGTKQMFAKFGTSLYRGDDSTGAMTQITLGSGASLFQDGYVDWTVANNTLLVVDQSGFIQKYRGSTNANYSTGTITVTGGSAIVTGSGTTWATTTNAEVGEYIKLPDGKWYLIKTIGSNTSITIELNYQGPTLSGQTYVISPWGEVQGKLNSSVAPTGLIRPKPKYIANHINRIWALEGNTLRFSVLDTSVAEENFNDWDTGSNAGSIIIPSGKGDTGTGLYSLNNSLYIFQRRAIWRLYGNSPGNFELRNVSNEIGMIDKRTLVEWNDLLIFLSDLGVYLFDGSNLKNVSENKINTTIDSWANKTSPTAVLWDNRYVISNTSSANSFNNEAYVLDLTDETWTRFKNIHISGFSSWTGSTDDGRIYFTSSNQGSIYRWDIGGNDDGYPIITEYDTPSIGFTSGMNDKAIKKFYIQQLALGDWNMDVTQLSNINETSISGQSINLSGGQVALWDVAEFDVSSFSGEGAIITTRIAEFQGLAKYFKFRMKQEGYNEGIEILGVVATARKRRLQ
jgi:hypothetical protein